jgi:hypothetical protein
LAEKSLYNIARDGKQLKVEVLSRS